MEGIYHKEHSDCLGRDMEYKVWGTSGKICLVFAPQNGRFWDFEDFGMVEAIAPWIESGRLQVVEVDSIDGETWSAQNRPEADRIALHERWFDYVTTELLPTLIAANPQDGLAMTCGCSMGGMHAANYFFRRPDLFDTVCALSGVYEAEFFIPGYTDPRTYANSPVDYLRGMEPGHEYIDMYRASDIILCVGQGDWEEDLLRSTRRLDAVLQDKGIPAWVDYWGTDVAHDWPWWRKQLPYFMGHLMGDA